MTKINEIARIIRTADTIEEMVELLFWKDCYIVDDNQWIYDANLNTFYTHTFHFYRSVMDLHKVEDVTWYEETDEEMTSELETF